MDSDDRHEGGAVIFRETHCDEAVKQALGNFKRLSLSLRLRDRQDRSAMGSLTNAILSGLIRARSVFHALINAESSACCRGSRRRLLPRYLCEPQIVGGEKE